MSSCEILPVLDPADELAEAHRLALKALREKGMDIATRLHARSEEPEADLGEIAVKFARVARAVRQTIALEARMAEETRRRKAAVAVEADAHRPSPIYEIVVGPTTEARRRIAARRLEAVNLVGRAVARTPGLADRERVYEQLFDRLDADDDEITGQGPMNEIIAGLCREFGLAPDWASFTKPDWRLVEPETRLALLRTTGLPPGDGASVPAATSQAPPDPQADPAPEPGRRRRERPPPSSWM